MSKLYTICIWMGGIFCEVGGHLHLHYTVCAISGKWSSLSCHFSLTCIPFLKFWVFQWHKRGWNMKGKVWKPSLSLTFISYSKQMGESACDESEPSALSQALKATGVINLYWIGSQILMRTLPDSPVILLPSCFGSKGFLLLPPPASPALQSDALSQSLLNNRDQGIAVRGQQIWMKFHTSSYNLEEFTCFSLRVDKWILDDQTVKDLHGWQNNYSNRFWRCFLYVCVTNCRDSSIFKPAGRPHIYIIRRNTFDLITAHMNIRHH